MSDSRHEQAKKLIKNGWHPIRIKPGSKGCFETGWTTETDLMGHFPERVASSVGIGFRCDDYNAIDLDIVDPDMLAVVNEIRVEILGDTPLVRVGRAPREIYVYRGAIHGGSTIKMTDGDEMACVDVLGIGKQFVGYGIHPGTDKPYTWVGNGEPLDTLVESLPAVTQSQIHAFIMEVNRVMLSEYSDWEQVTSAGEEGSIGESLPAGMVFSTADGPVTLEGAIANGFDVRCSWEGCAHVNDSGILHVEDGNPRLYDFGTGRMRFPELPSLDDMVVALEAQGIVNDGGGVFGKVDTTPVNIKNEDPEKILAYIIARYAYSAEDNSVWCMYTRTPLAKRTTFASYYTQTVMRVDKSLVKEKEKPLSIVRLWDHSRVAVRGSQFDPRTSEAILVDSHDQYINEYVAPAFSSDGGSLGLFLHHLNRLIPDEHEREVMTDWISAVISRPYDRLTAVLMISADCGGNGKGLLYQMIARAVGKAYSSTRSMSELVKGGYQDQYVDWMEKSLFIHVPEAKALDISGVSPTQQAAHIYEEIKETLDPGGRERKMTVKGMGKGGQGNVMKPIWFSTFIASNHWDAIALPEDDRRITTIEAGGHRLDSVEVREVLDWIACDANIGALIKWAGEHKRMAYTDLAHNVITQSRARAISEGKPPITEELYVLLENTPVHMFLKQDLLAKLTKEFPDNKYLGSVINQFCRGALIPLDRKDPRKQFRVMDARERPFVRKNCSKKVIEELQNNKKKRDDQVLIFRKDGQLNTA